MLILFIHAQILEQEIIIKEIEKQKLKMIAGRIFPAMATTTAAITGIACLQIYTLKETNKINYFRNCYLNLVINRFIMTMTAQACR